MNENPLVSCIITTYKRSPEIVERALKSIVDQSYDNIEIFLINDYPEDTELVLKLKGLVEKYSNDRIIKYIVVEKNSGACKARNLGINNASGEYVAFLDDDDEWLLDKIELQVKKAIEDGVTLVYCNSITRYLDLNKEKYRFKSTQPSGYIFNNMLYSNLIGSCSFPLIKKDVLVQLGGFNEDMPAMQDWELYLRITKIENVAYIDKPLVIYYSYNGERISRNFKGRSKAFEIIYDEHKEYIQNDEELIDRFNQGFLNVYTNANNKKNAFRYYWKVTKKRPFNFLNNIKNLIFIFIKPLVTKRKM